LDVDEPVFAPGEGGRREPNHRSPPGSTMVKAKAAAGAVRWTISFAWKRFTGVMCMRTGSTKNATVGRMTIGQEPRWGRGAGLGRGVIQQGERNIR